jgi:Ca-activated chloride channel family protein
MRGRHSRHARARRGVPVSLLIGVSVVAVAASVGAVVLWRSGTSEHGANPRSQSLGTTPTCIGALPLQVDAAPSIAAPVTAIARSWSATHPSARGSCVHVTVNSVGSAAEERRLASAPSVDTTVWIPDSSLWAKRLATDETEGVGGDVRVDLGAPIASSPLVLVAAPRVAARLRHVAWNGVVSGKPPTTIPDPTVSTEGLLSLLAMRFAGGTGGKAMPNAQLVGVMVAVSHADLPNTAAGFAKLTTSPASAPVFAASEQEVIDANKAAGSTVATALYPSEGTLSLDYPVVRLAHADDASGLGAAAKAFEQQLRTEKAVAQFATAGLRDGSGGTLRAAVNGVEAGKVARLPMPDNTDALDAVRMWSAASQDSRLLAVIDVSGSMNDRTPSGQTKIQIVAGAVQAAQGFFPESGAVGLWVFSTNQTPSSDWAQLVPLGPLDAKVGRVTRRQAIFAAAASMPSRVGGNTGLYDTTLAAFDLVQDTYDPSKVNSVVVFTDGRNIDPGGQTLAQLLAALRARVDPARPGPIITIGTGADIDIPALQAISAVTGGKTYVVKDPRDIRDVFLDAILQRECRPNC